jgi:hypothetical protein
MTRRLSHRRGLSWPGIATGGADQWKDTGHLVQGRCRGAKRAHAAEYPAAVKRIMLQHMHRGKGSASPGDEAAGSAGLDVVGFQTARGSSHAVCPLLPPPPPRGLR